MNSWSSVSGPAAQLGMNPSAEIAGHMMKSRASDRPCNRRRWSVCTAPVLVLDRDERPGDGGGARTHPQPAIDLVEVRPDCSLLDTETSCDLVVREALCHERK